MDWYPLQIFPRRVYCDHWNRHQPPWDLQLWQMGVWMNGWCNTSQALNSDLNVNISTAIFVKQYSLVHERT